MKYCSQASPVLREYGTRRVPRRKAVSKELPHTVRLAEEVLIMPRRRNKDEEEDAHSELMVAVVCSRCSRVLRCATHLGDKEYEGSTVARRTFVVALSNDCDSTIHSFCRGVQCCDHEEHTVEEGIGPKGHGRGNERHEARPQTTRDDDDIALDG